MIGTIWLHDDTGVIASVAVMDPNERDWSVRWDNADGVDYSTMSRASADYVGSLASASQSLGDTDDGTHRTIRLRPEGQTDPCVLKMHVNRIW